MCILCSINVSLINGSLLNSGLSDDPKHPRINEARYNLLIIS